MSKARIEALISALRTKIKAAGFKARVSKLPGYADQAMRVSVPTFETEFTPDQIRLICETAIAAGFTYVRKLPINVDFEVTKRGFGLQWTFYA